MNSEFKIPGTLRCFLGIGDFAGREVTSSNYVRAYCELRFKCTLLNGKLTYGNVYPINFFNPGPYDWKTPIKWLFIFKGPVEGPALIKGELLHTASMVMAGDTLQVDIDKAIVDLDPSLDSAVIETLRWV